MKTTLELPDDLMREIKVRAALEDRKLKDLIAELLRRGLTAAEAPKPIIHRVKFPIVRGTHPAAPDEEITPQRAHEILLDQEAQAALRAAGLD
jgi:hypothetical protein